VCCPPSAFVEDGAGAKAKGASIAVDGLSSDEPRSTREQEMQGTGPNGKMLERRPYLRSSLSGPDGDRRL